MNLIKIPNNLPFQYATESTLPYITQYLLTWMSDLSRFNDFVNLSWLVDEDHNPYWDAIYEAFTSAVAEREGEILDDGFIQNEEVYDYYCNYISDCFDHFHFHFVNDLKIILEHLNIMYTKVYDTVYDVPDDTLYRKFMKNSSLQEVWETR